MFSRLQRPLVENIGWIFIRGVGCPLNHAREHFLKTTTKFKNKKKNNFLKNIFLNMLQRSYRFESENDFIFQRFKLIRDWRKGHKKKRLVRKSLN